MRAAISIFGTALFAVPLLILDDPGFRALAAVTIFAIAAFYSATRIKNERIRRLVTGSAVFFLIFGYAGVCLRLLAQPTLELLKEFPPKIRNVSTSTSDLSPEGRQFCTARHLAAEVFGGYTTAPVRVFEGALSGQRVRVVLLTGTQYRSIRSRAGSAEQATWLSEDFAAKFGLANRYRAGVDQLLLGPHAVIHPEEALLLVGHSLGGMTAQAVAYDLMARHRNVVGVIAFGSPQIWNPAMRIRTDPRMHRITLHGDVISNIMAWLDLRWLLHGRRTPALLLRDGMLNHLAYEWDWRMQTRDIFGNSLLTDSPFVQWARSAFDFPEPEAFSEVPASRSGSCLFLDFASEKDYFVLEDGRNIIKRAPLPSLAMDPYVGYAPLTRDIDAGGPLAEPPEGHKNETRVEQSERAPAAAVTREREMVDSKWVKQLRTHERDLFKVDSAVYGMRAARKGEEPASEATLKVEPESKFSLQSIIEDVEKTVVSAAEHPG